MNPDYIIQTLGAIVQAYASILAIVGAFYVFVIERNRTELRGTDRLLDSHIANLDRKFRGIDFLRIRIQLKEKGVDWLESKLKQDLPDRWKGIVTSTEYINMSYDLRRFESLQKRTGMWTFRFFNGMFAYCSIVLILSLVTLYAISIKGLNDYIIFAYYLSASIAILGIAVFIGYVKQLAKMNGVSE